VKLSPETIAKYSNQLGAIVALSASTLSLLSSTVFNLIPCTLCYWQRIFMYPLAFIYIGAMWRQDAKTYTYSLPLAIGGAGFAAYHYALQMGWIKLAESCVGSVSCTEIYLQFAGFFTIPLASLIGFAVVIVLSIIQWRNQDSPAASNQQSFTKQLQPVIVATLAIVLLASYVLQAVI